MGLIWPLKCACGQKLKSKRALNLHFAKLHVGLVPLYECKQCPLIRIAKRNTANKHAHKHHAHEQWSSFFRILPAIIPNRTVDEAAVNEEDWFDGPSDDDDDEIHFQEPCNEHPLVENEDNVDIHEAEPPPESPVQNERARFLEEIISDVTAESLNQRVMQLLLMLGTDYQLGPKGQDVIVEFMADLLEDLSALERIPLHRLKKLSTAKNRKAYMVADMGLVLPVEVILGESPVTATSRKKRNRGVIESNVESFLEGSSYTGSKASDAITNEKKYGYIIPLRKSLSLLLKNEEFFNHIVNPQDICIPTNDEDCGDQIITSEWQSDNVLIVDIFIGLSFDDAEITSPMKQAKTRHKMFIALYEVLNIPPRVRGKDVTKQLLYICKSSYRTDFKNADAKLLQDLIDLVKASAEGIQLTDDPNLKFRINVVQVTADNPAAASILKMKCSGAFTNQPCFRCWASMQDIKRTKDLGKKRRSRRAHEKLCEALRRCQTPQAHEEFSKQTGIIGRSPLLDIPGFDLSKIAIDPMHSMLESGILTTIVKYYLADLIQRGLVGKEQLQNKLKRWRFYNPDGERSTGTLEINVREPWKSRISFGAIAFLKMAKELPFIVEEYDKDSEKRHHFVKAMRLAVLCTYPPYFTYHGAERLRHVFLTLRDDFLRLYPGAWITAKWHAFLHIPEDVPRLGAPKAFSCLQSERKYHTIKQQGVRQTKNVAFTLANRTALITLNQLFSWGRNGRCSKSLEPEFTTKPMSEDDTLKLPCHIRRQLTDEEVTCGLKQVNVGRFIFYKGTVVEISALTDRQPVFGVIQHIAQTPNGVSLVVFKSTNAVYQPLYGWYEIQQGELERIFLSDLEMKVTLSSIRFNGNLFVLREYAPILEFPL